MGTYESRGGRPSKRDGAEARAPHFLEDRLIAALFVHHRSLVPWELERRLLPMCVPQPEETVVIIRNVFKDRPPATVIYLPDLSCGHPNEPRLPGKRKASIIIREVCIKHNITLEAFFGPLKVMHIAMARREVFYRIAKETDMTLPAIGRFVKRDHTTVIHGINKYCHAEGVAQPRKKKVGFGAGDKAIQASLVD